MLIYDLTLDAHFGGVQEAFTLARSLADFTRHTVTLHGNTLTVEVRPGMTDDDCHRAYDAAIGHAQPLVPTEQQSTDPPQQ